MPDAPLVLAFDTSAAHCAAALLSGKAVLGSVRHEMQRGQAEALMGICESLLADHGHGVRDLSALGVGIGPGNFTGIRIAVSAARGLALGLGIPAIGINGFDALRYGHEGPCACAIDARRGQVYFQAFEPTKANAPILCDAADLPAHDGPLIGAGGTQPTTPTAVAIAHLCRERMDGHNPRPAPLYLRPADAAPSRDAPPVLLA